MDDTKINSVKTHPSRKFSTHFVLVTTFSRQLKQFELRLIALSSLVFIFLSVNFCRRNFLAQSKTTKILNMGDIKFDFKWETFYNR